MRTTDRLPLEELKSGQASREQMEGWRERGNQSPALPARGSGVEPQKPTHFLQSEGHYLGQDSRKSTNAKIVNVNFLFVPLTFCP